MQNRGFTKLLDDVTDSAWVDIIAETTCTRILIDELRSVAGYPTTALHFRGSASEVTEEVLPGVGIYLEANRGVPFQPTLVYGQVKTKSGTTDLIQKEYGG